MQADFRRAFQLFIFLPRLWGVLEDINQSREPRQSFVSSQYFGVLRNYRRYGWLVLYLFGTSPAVSKSFLLAGREKPPWIGFDGRILSNEPFGTSLPHERLGLSQQESGKR